MDRFRARLLRRHVPQQSQPNGETITRDDGVNIATTRRRSAHPVTTLAKPDSTNAKDENEDTTPVKEDPVSPLVSTRNLRSAKRDSTTYSVQPFDPPPKGQSISGTSLQSQEHGDLPPAKSTRFSIKQQQEPQTEPEVIAARRRSLRGPPAKPTSRAEGSPDEVRVLRQSARRKSNVDQPIDQYNEERSEERSFSVPNKRRSTRHVSTKEVETTDAIDHDDTSLSPTTTRSLRSFPKNKPPSPPKVTTRLIGSILVITGIRSWPEEHHTSLKIKLKTSGHANGESPSNSSRKRRRVDDDIAVKDEEHDGPLEKRAKETDSTARIGRVQRKLVGKVELARENDITQHYVIDDDESQLEDSFELVRDDEKDSRADRAARRNAKSEQAGQSQPEDELESSTRNAKKPNCQDEPANSGDSLTKDDDTLPPPISPNFLPTESLPPIFLDFPEQALPETAFPDKAAHLHAQRYRPLPPLARFTAALLSHPPTSRSTETLLALATNTQRALQAYQDEYIELDLKTSRVSGPIPKKPATGGRQVMDEIKWQAEKEKELFGEGSILASLRKAAVDTTTKRQKERKARRGEVDMLAAGLAPGKTTGAGPKIHVSDADEIAERGRAQRSRKPVKRFEDAIADAERAPSKRRKKNFESLTEGARSSAPPAALTVKKTRKSSEDKSKAGSDVEEEEGLIKPKWNNPSRPQSSLAKTAQPKQATTKPASTTTQIQPPNQPPEARQHPHYMPPYHHPAVMPGYPVYSPYPPPPGAYYPPYAGHYPGHPMPALPPQAAHEQYYAHPPPHYYHPHPAAIPPGHHPQSQHMHPQHAQHYAQHPLAQSTLPPQAPPHPQSYPHPHPPHMPHPDHPTASSANSAQPHGQLPGSKDRRKVPSTSGTPANSSTSTPRSRKEPHEKSELRSASMTKWWAERKVKMAAQKEQEKKDAEAAALAETEADAEAKADVVA